MTPSARPEDLLTRARRCVVGAAGGGGPEVMSTAFWFDGRALWMAAAAATLPTAARSGESEAVAYVPPVDAGEPGVMVHGRARAYSPHDPVGLVFHTATISAAMTALAVRNPGGVLGSLRDAARAPRQWVSSRRLLVLRLVAERLTAVDPPDLGHGMAPALPTVVPSDVRRALAGRRRVVLVYSDDTGPQAVPAVWDAGYALRTPPTLRPPAGARAVAAVDGDGDGDGRHGGGRSIGLALEGVIDQQGRLVPDRATSWDAPYSESAEVSPPIPGGVVLPD